nr:zinc carboxypeptidase A 1-like [Onthophagus taurus]
MYLELLAKVFPRRVKLCHIGRTIRGRKIDMIIIAKNLKNKKYAVLIDGGIHAREWITVTSALYFINHLIKSPKLLSFMDFYIIPCLNPDGYEYTHVSNRMWRKNLNTNKSTCVKKFGVDLNRNFPFKFGDPKGSSGKRESMCYRGEFALSEPETLALATIFKNLKDKLKLYVSLHAYGNLIMYPWGYKNTSPWDRYDLFRCGQLCKQAMSRCGVDRKFKVGNIAKFMYLTSGCSVDYARGGHDVKFSFTIELDKGGSTGFNPQPSKILEIGSELTNGIGAMVRYVHKYYAIRDGRRAHCNREHFVM